MHLNTIARVLGILLMIFSLTMLTPIVVAVLFEESTEQTFLLGFAITFLAGASVWYPSRRHRGELRSRDGFLVTFLFWLVLSSFGTLPLMITSAPHLNFTDAMFESISGLTTTGATVIEGLDHLPKSILYYRQQLHWLGGIGIVVIAVAILPMLGVGGMQLYRAETPGPIKDSKLTPRITETAAVLFRIYLVITISCTFAYWLAGMSLFDALTYSYATVSTGGFGNYDANLGYFESTPIYLISCFFMTISAINFSLHYYTWVNPGIKHYWNNPEARMYLTMLLGGSVIVCGALYASHYYQPRDALVQGVVQTISIMTSTGFTTANFSQWPTFLPLFLVVLSFFGGCAGSTGGGIKIGRMLLLAQQGLRELYRLVHPSALRPIKIRGRRVPDRVLDAVWAFFGVYLVTFYVMVLILLATGLDYVTAWSCTAAAINNMGPGLGAAAVNYGDLNLFAKWVLCAGMLLGRLELFTLLVLFTPAYWRG